jgi:hypothetical protein
MSQFPTNITPEQYLKRLPAVQPNLDCTQLQAKINDLTLELTSNKERLSGILQYVENIRERESGSGGLNRTSEILYIELNIQRLERDLSTTQEEYNQKCGKENNLPKTDSTKQLIYVGLGIVAILVVTKLISKKG